MVWLHLAVWLLAAVSAYAALDVLDGQYGVTSGDGRPLGPRGASRPLLFGVGSAGLVILGVCLPMGATACLLLGTGLGVAAYALFPVMGLDARPVWVRRVQRPGSRPRRRG